MRMNLSYRVRETRSKRRVRSVEFGCFFRPLSSVFDRQFRKTIGHHYWKNCASETHSLASQMWQEKIVRRYFEHSVCAPRIVGLNYCSTNLRGSRRQSIAYTLLNTLQDNISTYL